MLPRGIIAIFGSAISLCLAAPAYGQSFSSSSVSVGISGGSFSSTQISMMPGGTVTWTNQDSVPHTVTSTDGGPLDSGPIQPGHSYTYTFTRPGTYAYHCTLHPAMTGTVTVATASAATTPASMPLGPVYPSSPPNPTPPPGNLPVTGPDETLPFLLLAGGGALIAYGLSLGRSRPKPHIDIL